ncbi:MAG TPA: RICIN domain-containing protein [Polyangia bacterium]|jgi:hypothetical protein|nr:RICIN domain-containing protein [Polyangia bacterium]
MRNLVKLYSSLTIIAVAGAACGPGPNDSLGSENSGDPTGSVGKATSAITAMDQVIADLKAVFKLANKYGDYYAKAKKGVDFAKAVLEFFDIAQFPSEESVAIAALSAQVNQLGADIIWYISTSDTSDQLAALMSDLQTTGQILEQGKTNPAIQFNTTSVAYTTSGEHLAILENDMHFLRYYRPSLLDGRNVNWVNVILPADRTEAEPFAIAENTGGQFVYDWRMGVARMITGIAARITILTAADPGFTLSLVRDEMMGHRAALLKHYDKMVAGVKCNFRDVLDSTSRPTGNVEVVCADIYSGYSQERDLPHGNLDNAHDSCKLCISDGSGHCLPTVYPNIGYDQQCLASVDANWSAFWNNVFATQEQLRRTVLASMPLFEMRDLINTLYAYANPAPDLTEMRQQISNFSEQLCLDIQNGNPGAGTPVWMWPCSGAGHGAQWWRYSRTDRTIVNPSSNRCLDVKLDSGGLFRPLIADCNDADSQRWSFDPTSNEIYSGVGSTTTLFGGTSQAEFPSIAWKIPGYGYFLEPFWHVDSANPCQSGPPLSTNDGACVSQICAVDSFCCNTLWDGSCVNEVSSVCNQSCPPGP